MFVLYQLILTLLLALTSPYFLIRSIFGKHGLKQRLGLWKFIPDARKTVWLHAASMGELKVIATILPELLNKNSELRIVITTITKTGMAGARSLPYAVEAFYLPIDLQHVVGRIVKKVKPSLFVLVETELWPALIRQLHRQGAVIAVANGRISRKSYNFYRICKPLFHSTLGKLGSVMVQTENDARRFIQLGAQPDRVAVYGNTKFDQVLLQSPRPLPDELKTYLGCENAFVFVAGSARPGEFQILIEALQALLTAEHNCRCVIAPRHLKDVGRLEERLKMANQPYLKRTALSKDLSQPSSILILDSMGELAGLYRCAHLAFVGGSLVNLGGHDPLEPASAGCAVCFGPHMDNSRLFADLLIESGTGFIVSTASELSRLLCEFASDRSRARELGEKARQAVLSHSGVSRKIAARLLEYL